MRLAGIILKRILRLPSNSRAGTVNIMAKFSTAVIIVAATTAAAQTAPASSEYDAAILSALTLPVKDALRGLDSLSRVQGAPGWVRAKSLKLLGDHQFIKADYKKAADFYQQASKLDNSSLYKHLYALALAADGRLDAARDIWGALAGDPADIMSGEASSLLQETAPAGQPVSSTPSVTANAEKSSIPLVYPQNQQSTSSNTITNISSTPNVQQAATSNFSNNPQQTAANAEKSSIPLVYPQNQQSTSSNTVTNISSTTQVQQVATVSSQEKITLYTVQIGAFGSKENADNLVKKLSDTYKDITISPTASGDQTLYRVRIGTFQNREDANAFADKLITTAGLSARVFEK